MSRDRDPWREGCQVAGVYRRLTISGAIHGSGSSDVPAARTGLRPQPTLGLWSDSVGNASVTCRSADNHVERQLRLSGYGRFVPFADAGEK